MFVNFMENWFWNLGNERVVDWSHGKVPKIWYNGMNPGELIPGSSV